MRIWATLSILPLALIWLSAWKIVWMPYPKWLRKTVAITTILMSFLFSLTTALALPKSHWWDIPSGAIACGLGLLSARIWKRYRAYQTALEKLQETQSTLLDQIRKRTQ